MMAASNGDTPSNAPADVGAPSGKGPHASSSTSPRRQVALLVGVDVLLPYSLFGPRPGISRNTRDSSAVTRDGTHNWSLAGSHYPKRLLPNTAKPQAISDFRSPRMDRQ